jgi:hypothetical protein
MDLACPKQVEGLRIPESRCSQVSIEGSGFLVFIFWKV